MSSLVTWRNVIKKKKWINIPRDDKIRINNIEKSQHISKVLINTTLLQKHSAYNRSNFRREGYYYVDTIKPP